MRMTKAAYYPGITALAPAQSLPAQWTRLLLLSLAGVLLASCGGGEQSVRSTAPPPSSHDWTVVAPANPAASNAVLMRAISLVGTPYKWGGNTPQSGFDCSGLVNYVYQDMLQIDLPRTSSALAAYQGPRIKPKQLTAGDLVFFGSGGHVSHVGIYVGNGRFVHAPSNGGTVRLDHLDGYYWRDHYSGAKRVVR
ncbi:C40 family peptidase [Lysobacter sp. A286]